MLLLFTDAQSNTTVAVNPNHVVAVFTAAEGEHSGKTVIGVVNGNLLVNESQVDVIGQLQGALK